VLKSFSRKIGKIKFHVGLGRFKKKETADTPTHIQLEPTVRCNLHCITCTRDTVIPTYSKMDLTVEEINKILSFFPNLKSVKLQGLGEPLFHPQIEEILRKFKERKVRVWMISNGTLFLTEKFRSLLLDYVSDVAISFDSTKKEVFNQLRRPADMDKIVQGIKLLVNERNKRKSNLTIGINFVISHMNYTELPELYDMAVDMKLDYVSVVDVENWMIAGEMGYDESRMFVGESRKYVDEIAKGIKQLRMRLLKKGIVLGYKNHDKRIGKCYWPFKSMFITVEGLATPCCMRMHREHSLGNILEAKSLNDVWNGKKYTEFRKAHIKNDTTNEMCGNCPD